MLYYNNTGPILPSLERRLKAMLKAFSEILNAAMKAFILLNQGIYHAKMMMARGGNWSC